MLQRFENGWHLRREADRVLDRDQESDAGARLLFEAAGIADALEDVPAPLLDHQAQDDVATGGQVQA